MQVQEELDEVLKRIVGRKLILEIGTARGGTLYQFLKNADDDAEIMTIDLPNGKFGGEKGIQDEQVMQSWKKNGQILHIVRGDSTSIEVVRKITAHLQGRKFDFVFIDGDHTYSVVKSDYLTYREFTNGIMVFHDIAMHKNNPEVGVKRFWDELEGDKIEIIKDHDQGWAGIGIIESCQ